MVLTKNFTLEEMTATSHVEWQKENSNPPKEVIYNLQQLCENILQPIRDGLGIPIKVTSGYRCPGLNKAVGGAKSSQHLEGKAADIVLSTGSNLLIFEKVLELKLPIDQMINEFNYKWIHISYVRIRMRGEVLLSLKEKGKTIYKHF